MKTVPRIGRILDATGLVLFLCGGGVFVWAWLGFQGIPELVPTLEGQARSAVAVADGYWRLQKIGVGLMVGGVAVFVLAWWVAREAHRRPSEASS